jgi:hypothetical protein
LILTTISIHRSPSSAPSTNARAKPSPSPPSRFYWFIYCTVYYLLFIFPAGQYSLCHSFYQNIFYFYLNSSPLNTTNEIIRVSFIFPAIYQKINYSPLKSTIQLPNKMVLHALDNIICYLIFIVLSVWVPNAIILK